MLPDSINAFELLGLTVAATTEELNRAFRIAAVTAHPDKGGSSELFHKLARAKEIMACPTMRAAHLERTCPMPPGTWVILHGIASENELNGATGIAGAFDGLRIKVALSAYRTVSVKANCVQRTVPMSSWPHSYVPCVGGVDGGICPNWAFVHPRKGRCRTCSSSYWWQAPPPQAAPPRRPPPPQLSTASWTSDEWDAAEAFRGRIVGEPPPSATGIVAGDVFAMSKMAVECAAATLASDPLNEEELLRLARAFQLAVQMEKDAGRFVLLEKALRTHGTRGLEFEVWATVPAGLGGTGLSEAFMVKTLGDVLQRDFEMRDALRNGAADHSLLSGYNAAQHAVAVWLQLPDLLFAIDAANAIMAWSVHNMADLNEAVSLYLPVKLLETYMRIQSNFHRLFLWTGNVKCSHVDAISGICYKDCRWQTSSCGRH